MPLYKCILNYCFTFTMFTWPGQCTNLHKDTGNISYIRYIHACKFYKVGKKLVRKRVFR